MGDTVVDLGDDEFTRGRPRPMIDPALRLQRFERKAIEPQVAVVLLYVTRGKRAGRWRTCAVPSGGGRRTLSLTPGRRSTDCASASEWLGCGGRSFLLSWE
ncbi:MAG: hypothetical protein AB1503_12970 [Bacillota bacterium]